MQTFHVLTKIHTKNSNNLTNIELGSKLLEDISDLIGTQIVDSSFHEFGPRGMTGFALLQESHISLHTWPEHGLIILDLLSCKPLPDNFEAGVKELLSQIFAVEKTDFKIEEV